MLFNSLAFLFLMIVVLLGLAAIRQRKWQHLFLLLTSYFFYTYSSGILILLIVFSTLLDYYVGLALNKTENITKRRLLLTISLVGNLGLLAVFKYTNFGIETINFFSGLMGLQLSLNTLNIVLPIGISFYTFQTLSYTIDVYRRKLKPTESLFKFALFVSFFPQLVAGPIVRAADFLPQLDKKVKLLPENFKRGLTLVAWGLVKKIIFADTIAIFVNSYFADPTAYAGSIPVYLASLAFGVQIYCDFSGYSDIAIGIARMLGFELRLNFDKPYFALNVSEFWRKWHISLSTWLRDYLYIPLGGNRKGNVRTYINLMITMILGGLWHGAAWNFLAWGFYQGALLSIHRLAVASGFTRVFDYAGKYSKYISLLVTQYFVFLGWLIFRVRNVSDMGFAIQKFIAFDFSGSAGLELLKAFPASFMFLALFLIIHTYTFYHKDMIEKIERTDMFYWSLYLLIVVLALFFLSPTETIPFIYFQF